MHTAISWADARDLGHLLWLRRQWGSRRRLSRLARWLLPAITLLAATVPAFVDRSAHAERAAELVPVGLLAFLGLSVAGALASGGGRELLPREQALAYPITPATEHLGALALAPLNTAWLLQAWLLLGASAHAAGPRHLLGAQVTVLLWLGVATALAQAVGWTVEFVRRGPGGVWLVRAAGVVVVVAGVVGSRYGPRSSALLDQHGAVLDQHGATPVLAVLLVALVWIGVVPARACLARPPRDQAHLETTHHRPRPTPASDLLTLLRLDRASVWRSVPMRRGLAVLAIGPGLMVLGAGASWQTLGIVPPLVIAGAALLFGVNAWCLDGRGLLWRESLPVDPRTVFLARTLLLVEVLALASLIPLLLGALRAGPPRASDVLALALGWLVALVQVLAACLRWSGGNPQAADLRSARATPAPPLAMVGYSTRLSLSVTLTWLVVAAAAGAAWWLGVLVAGACLAWSSTRWLRALRRWVVPAERAAVTMAVTS